MRANNKRLKIFSEAEKIALYGLPDFDDFQRAEYFVLTNQERILVDSCNNFSMQVYCALQIVYFKAKQAFFEFSLSEVSSEDITTLLRSYFPEHILLPPFWKSIPRKEYYRQRHQIAKLFGYRLWQDTDMSILSKKMAKLTKRDVSTTYLLAELLALLNVEKIVRPGFTTMQTIISDVLTAERLRLRKLLHDCLDKAAKIALETLLVRDDILSDLAALKQDAKHFGWRVMMAERRKYLILTPMYRLAQDILPKLEISQQNRNYYASLAHYYTIYDLRRLKPEQTYLYLLCYVWQRYRQLTDNLFDAFSYHMKRLKDEIKEQVDKQVVQEEANQRNATPQIGRLLLLYVDDGVDDSTPFGRIRERAFAIMPKETLLLTGKRLRDKPMNQMEFRWQVMDRLATRCKKYLRPLCMALEFSSTTADNPWLAALSLMKRAFERKQKLGQLSLNKIPQGTIPKRLYPYLLLSDNNNVTSVQADRYEFWVYYQIRKRLGSGELYLNNSIQYRCFNDELVSLAEKAEVLLHLNIPWLQQPVKVALDRLFSELASLWQGFDRELRQSKLKHLDYDSTRKILTWRKPKSDRENRWQSGFYAKLPIRDLADVFRFVNEHCHFLSTLTPLQPRYAKKIADEDCLMAVIIAQAMNHGNFGMAETCDIPYHILEATHQQYLRLSSLQAANDQISNAVARLSIFPYYSFDLEILYGSVDGQKFEVADPTIKARYSRKYFGRGMGVVAYTLLANHLPLQSQLIGANEHESHYVFDICYHNTTEIMPDTITGDMHSINKANFAILHWFGMNLNPRFTNLQAQLKHLYCGSDLTEYQHYLIQPIGQIDRLLIEEEKGNIDQIVATLGLKEITQSSLIRKLCTYTKQNRTRKAIFEFDALVRSIYTLRYMRDPQLQRNVHRSQNRIEAYHQLRSVITQVAGKKQLIGKTDLDIAISNQCGRLIANVVIAYNSILLSQLLDKYQSSGNQKALALLKKISPVAWQHIHFLGHYNFRDNKHPIDLDTILAHVNLE